MVRQKKASSDLASAFDNLCLQLEQAIVGEKSSASFACGGAIPIANPHDTIEEAQAANVKTAKPIKISWETKEGQARKLLLPLHAATAANADCPGDAQIRHLVSDCDPVGFGRGQVFVMDRKYRKADKLDPDRFATSFNPLNHGIVEILENILVPQLDISSQVKIELYKLNVHERTPSCHNTVLDANLVPAV